MVPRDPWSGASTISNAGLPPASSPARRVTVSDPSTGTVCDRLCTTGAAANAGNGRSTATNIAARVAIRVRRIDGLL